MDTQENFYEQTLCRRCQTRTIDKSENPDSCLCSECRKELIKLRVPLYMKITAIAALVLMLVTFVLSIPDMQSYGIYRNAEKKAENGYIVSAMDELVDILEQNPSAKDVAVKLTDIGMEYEYYDYAAYAIDNYLVGRDVSDSVYNKVTDYIDELNIYYATADKAAELFEQSGTDSAATIEEYMAAMDAYYAGLEEMLTDSEYNEEIVYYYMSYAANDETQREACLEKCIELSDNNFDAYAQLANIHRRNGDLDKAEELLKRAYSRNREDTSVIRSYAILEMLKGNPEQGLTLAKTAYDTYPEGDYVADTYIIALAANDRLEEAEEVKQEWEAEDYLFDETLEDFLAGEINLTQYYTNEGEEE